MQSFKEFNQSRNRHGIFKVTPIGDRGNGYRLTLGVSLNTGAIKDLIRAGILVNDSADEVSYETHNIYRFKDPLREYMITEDGSILGYGDFKYCFSDVSDAENGPKVDYSPTDEFTKEEVNRLLIDLKLTLGKQLEDYRSSLKNQHNLNIDI